MSSTLKAIRLGALLLASSTMFFMHDASAQSCTTDAWDSTAGTPSAGTPPTVKRYSGACGLAADAQGEYVVESTNHDAEGDAAPFSARFYVYTGVTSGTPVIYRALDADSGGGTVIQVAYDAASQNFDFTVGGNTATTSVDSALRNRWIGVEFKYETGQPLQASTRSAGDVTTLASPPTAATATIEAVQLGMIEANGASGTLYFDEYEASRADTGGMPIPALCRGDVNNSGGITAGDRAAITAEISGTLASGQSDCNENGSVTAGDRACITALISSAATCN